MKKSQIEPTVVAAAALDVSAEEIVDYLQANPDFFTGRDDLLTELTIPHARGTSVSLVERQMSLLRERNRALRSELDKLLDAAKDNDATFTKCRKLVLSLLEAKSGTQLLEQLAQSLSRDFGCERYRLFIYADEHHQVNQWVTLLPKDEVKGAIGGLVSSRKPVLGVLRDTELDYLFGSGAGKVASTGVFPIRRKRDVALLALGSSNPTQFQSGMGTLFTDFIADTLARLLPEYTFL